MKYEGLTVGMLYDFKPIQIAALRERAEKENINQEKMIMILHNALPGKAIYGMMIDRVSLSIKNGWLDEDGKTYIHYSVADIMADTGCGKNKILKCLKELEEDVQRTLRDWRMVVRR